MGGKKSSAAAPAPVERVPNESIAQSAAEKALAAQGDVTASAAGEEETARRAPVGIAATVQKPKPKPVRDPSAVAAGNVQSSAVITG